MEALKPLPGVWEEFAFEAWHAHIGAQLLSSRLNVTDDDFFVVLNRKPKAK
jgi:hypothetical protein